MTENGSAKHVDDDFETICESLLCDKQSPTHLNSEVAAQSYYTITGINSCFTYWTHSYKRTLHFWH